MNVKKLKELVANLPDDMKVYIPGHPTEGFTGLFISPCEVDSDVQELGLEDLDDEEIHERELLGKEIPMEKAFVLVPCGYYEEHDHTHELN
jgi:hypothetical protein